MAELTRRTAMLSAVAYAATRIVADPAWRDCVPDLLARLGEATKMSRVTLFEAHDDAAGNLVQSCRMIGRSRGSTPSPTIPATMICR